MNAKYFLWGAALIVLAGCGRGGNGQTQTPSAPTNTVGSVQTQTPSAPTGKFGGALSDGSEYDTIEFLSDGSCFFYWKQPRDSGLTQGRMCSWSVLNDGRFVLRLLRGDIGSSMWVGTIKNGQLELSNGQGQVIGNFARM